MGLRDTTLMDGWLVSHGKGTTAQLLTVETRTQTQTRDQGIKDYEIKTTQKIKHKIIS